MKKIELIKFFANDLFNHCVMLGNTAYLYKNVERKEEGNIYTFLNTSTLKTESFTFSEKQLWEEVVMIF